MKVRTLQIAAVPVASSCAASQAADHHGRSKGTSITWPPLFLSIGHMWAWMSERNSMCTSAAQNVEAIKQ